MYRIDIKSDAIREIHTYLRELEDKEGITPKLSVDGVYGEETRRSVGAFQKREGLTETGEVDKETFDLLFAAYIASLAATSEESVLIPAAFFPLRMGDSGSFVRILQSVLNEVLSAHIPGDGFFGRATENGVREAEVRYGLSPSGSVSRALWLKLSHDYGRMLLEKSGE